MAQAEKPITPDPRAPSAPAPGHKWYFRLVAAIFLPLLLFGILEAVLRVAGYGYATSFFVRKTIQGTPMLVENASFGLRFFPPALARSPFPVVMRAEKPANVFRIFLFGESAALGDPRPAYGMGRYLETLLRERYPGMDFEVVCVAMTAINSQAILSIARECARYQGNLWIVYMGNNEMAGPFGANTVFGPQTPPYPAVRAYLALQQIRTGQLLVDLARRFNRNAATPSTWGGLKMFLEHQLPPTDPRRERVYYNFKRNLAGIVRAGRRAGVPVILSSVASNLKDCAPFGSQPAPVQPDSLGDQWQKLFQAGNTNAAQGQWALALTNYLEAAQSSPLCAELHFRLGQCRLAMTNFARARKSYELARDLDTLPFRADARINSLIAETARRYAGPSVYYLDAEKVLASLSPRQIPGQEFFFDHVHLNFPGNYQLARAFAEKAATWLPSSPLGNGGTGGNSDWAAPELCAQRLGLTDWNRCAALEEMGRRLSDAPFTNQFNHPARMKFLASQLAELKVRLHPRNVAEARATYETALQKRPQDHWLHQNYAEFLSATGNLPLASEQMRAAASLAPHYYAVHFQLGRLLARQKKYDEARMAFETALSLRGDQAEICLELGQMLAIQGKNNEALIQYANAQKYRPEEARVHLLRAGVLVKQNQRPQAIQSLREAIRLRPNYLEAHFLLGVELAIDGNFSEAQVQFEAVVRLRPEYAEGHLNLAIALARQERFEEALAHFQTTLRLDPQNEKARQFMADLETLKIPKTGPRP